MASTMIAVQTPEAQVKLTVKFFEDGRLYVQSASDPKHYYRIEFNGTTQQLTCTCPDHYHRERVCKHIRRAVEFLEGASLSTLSVSQKSEWKVSFLDATRQGHRAFGFLTLIAGSMAKIK